MKLRVRLFARLCELAGTDSLELELTPGSTAEHLKREIAKQRPRLQPLIGRCFVAADGEFLADHHVVDPAAELAVIPPVSGGSYGPPASRGD